MCAIIGSFSKDTLLELVELNSYRGNHSYSISEYSPVDHSFILHRKDFGPFSLEGIELKEGNYYVAHIQAPTTQSRDIHSIHPSAHGTKDYLWHNGIIKDDNIKWLQEKYNMPGISWDTALLHYHINRNGLESLSDINGTFSCLYYYYGVLYLFRNEISPMFIDDKFNISSTKFKGSKPTPPNRGLEMIFENRTLEEACEFKTAENPYYFG